MSRRFDSPTIPPRIKARQELEKPYIFTRGEVVDFYPVDPVTKRGMGVRPGEVVEDLGHTRVKVRDSATDEVYSIKPGQAWNDSQRAFDEADRKRVEEILDQRFGKPSRQRARR